MVKVDSMIAGVEKAGTTSIAAYLAQHPQILTHVGSDESLSQIEFSSFITGDSDERARFRKEFIETFGRLPNPGECVLAKSVGVMHSKEAVQRLHRHNPECRVIVSLRDPVERAYSSYWYQRWRGEERASSFEAALKNEHQRSLSGLENIDLSYLRKGRYVEDLSRLSSVFGRDQVHVIVLEEFRAKPRQSLKALYEFLSLPAIAFNMIEHQNTARIARWPWLSRFLQRESIAKAIVKTILPKHVRSRMRSEIMHWNAMDPGAGTRGIPPLKQETRRRLKGYFEPYTAELEDWLGRTLTNWRS